MKIKQFVGPFSNDNGSRSLPLEEIGNRKIVQIGIERPQSIPISEENTQQAILKINNDLYSIGELDVLEFENLYAYASKMSIDVVDVTNPYLIINIAYE